MFIARKEPTLEEVNADAQVLMNFLMDEAQVRLKTQGGFQPFAAAMANDGAVSFMPDRHPEEAPAQAIADRLAAHLRAMSEKADIRAAGLSADVRFGKQGAEERSDAVRLHIEHRDGYCADIFVPYKIRNNRRKPEAPNHLRFSHPIAQESARRFWVVVEDVS